MKNPSFSARAEALNEEEELLPEVLKNLGYQTHMVGKWHLGHFERRFHPVGRGFDSFCGNLAGSLDYFYHHVDGQTLKHDYHCATATAGVNGTCDEYASYYEDEETSEHKYEMQLTQPATESTFPDTETYGDFYITNIYGQKNVDVIEAHDPADGPLFLYSAFTAGHAPLQALADDFADCSPDISDTNRLVLCAMVKALDRNVGYIVDALKAKSMWDNTLFVFASDNGGATDMGSDNGPLRGTKGDMYEGGIVTPAFLHFGADTVDDVASTYGVTNNQPIHLVDLFKIFVSAALEGCGVYDFQNEVDGRDLWAYLSRGALIPERLAEVNFNIAAGPGFRSSESMSLYNDDGSYVEAVIATYAGSDYKLCRNCIGEYYDEIYDLTTDPSETTNLAGDPNYQDVEVFLDEILEAWVNVSDPLRTYPTLVKYSAELLESAGLDPDLADDLVNVNLCSLPLDSPEFLCYNCSQLLTDFPSTCP